MFTSSRLRAALLGTAAAGVLLLGYAHVDADDDAGGDITITNESTITAGQHAIFAYVEGSYGDIDIKNWADAEVMGDGHNFLIGSLFAHWGQSDTAVDVLGASGTADMDGLGGGGSLTFYGANGLYADLLGLATFYSTDLSAEGLGKLGMPNGIGYAASFELGKEYALRSGFSVVPQGQLVYQRIDLDNFTDTTGNPVSSEATDSLEGRLGLAAKATAALDGNMAAAFYTDANIIHEFLDPALVTIGGGTVTYNTNATSFEFGGGFNLFSNNGPVASTLYVDADYRMPLADPGTTVIEARAGMRFSF